MTILQAGKKSVLVRPDHGFGFYELPTDLIEMAKREIARHAALVGCQLEEKLTPCQLLVLMILKDSGVTAEEIAAADK